MKPGWNRRLAGTNGGARSLLVEPSVETIRRAEGGVGLGGLLGVVGGGVAAEHGRGGVAEEELDIDLAGLLFDGPGGEGVTKAMRVDLGDGGLFAEALEDGAHGGAAEGAAAAGEEEGARVKASKPAQVVLDRLAGSLPDSDHSLLVALAVADVDALAAEVDVLQLQVRQLAGAEAGVEEGENEGAVPGATANGSTVPGERPMTGDGSSFAILSWLGLYLHQGRVRPGMPPGKPPPDEPTIVTTLEVAKLVS